MKINMKNTIKNYTMNNKNKLLVASMSFSVKLLYRVAKNARKRRLSCLEVGGVESSVVFSELVLQQTQWILGLKFLF